MRKLALLVLISVSTVGFSQETEDESFFSLGITGEYISIDGLKPVITPGISGELRMGKYLGAEYTIAAIKDYYHFGSGLLFYPLFLLAEKTDSNYTILFLLMTLFEHTNIHFALGEHFEIVPNFSLLRIRYLWDREGRYDTSAFASGSIGTKLGILFSNNWSLNIFGEGTQLYHPGRPTGWQTGLSFVYHFPERK